MNNNVFAGLLLLVLAGAAYALGRAHRPRTPWEDGYRQGVADTTKAMLKNTVRAMEIAKNSAPNRFLPRLRRPARGRVEVAASLKDELTQPVTNPVANPPGRHAADDEDTTVRLLRQPPPNPDPDTEAAA